MLKVTRLILQQEIMKNIEYLLEKKQIIPVIDGKVDTLEVEENPNKMIAKDGTNYLLYTKNFETEDYIIKKLTKDKALKILFLPFKKMNKLKLEEERQYWEDYAEFFKDEENNNMVFSGDILVESLCLK